jgi:HEPN domain-containing protein
MNPVTQEWVDKAEGDFATANREFSVPVDPNFDAVCFHSQQCAEKYRKACLHKANIEFPRTHDLLTLMDLLAPNNKSLQISRLDLQKLTLSSVSLRYPGFFANKKAARWALGQCRKVRRFCRQLLELPGRR